MYVWGINWGTIWDRPRALFEACLGIIWDMSGASSGAPSGECLGHHLGHVWGHFRGIIWGCQRHHLGHVWGIIWGMSEAI